MPAALGELNDEIAKAARRFGPKNPLLTHLLHAKAALLCHDVMHVGSESVDNLCQIVSQIAACQFDTGSVVIGPAPVKWRNLNYNFSRSDFTKHYAALASRWEPGIRCALEWTPQHRDLFHRFIYVIGKNGEWRYFCEALPISVSITRRNNIERFPFHPLLANGLNLAVTVAGEIAFQWEPEQPFPSAVLVNNVSGHFRPEGWRSADLAGCVRSVLGLPAETLMIALANDGAHISGLESHLRKAISQ